MTQLAAQLYTLRNFAKTPADIARTLKRVRQIGYQAVQISGFGPADPAEIAKMLDGEGLACCSTHVGWQRFASELDKLIDEHRLWRCAHPAIGGMPLEYRNADGILKFAREATEVGKKLFAAGMDFSYHNHNFELAKAGGKTWLELLYENSDAKYVKAEIDTYWIQAGGGDPAAWIARYAGRMPILHLKDMVMSPDGKSQRFAEIGEGNLNWRTILPAAKAAGVEWYCVEQDDCYERDPFDSLKLSLENLHKMGLK
jgi:sugar phosphate isomerase/epimerase